jgi:cytochrome c peroxidase
MSIKVFVVFTVISALTVTSLSFKPEPGAVEKLFHSQVIGILHELEHFSGAIERHENDDILKVHFTASRLAYKRSSVLLDYFFPILFKSINGPDLKYAEDDNPDLIHEPHGFQVMERILYGKPDYHELKNECDTLIQLFRSINEQPELSFKFRDELVFDAMRSAVLRLMSLGITGFDSPVALNSIDESASVFNWNGRNSATVRSAKTTTDHSWIETIPVTE